MTAPSRGPSYLQLAALRDVIEGRRKYAYGIGRCSQCDEPWIKDGDFRYCPECRHGHRPERRCDQCRTRYRLEFVGHLVCPSCREQIALFPKPR